MATKNITVQDFLDALEANHVPHITGTWFSYKNQSVIGAACAMGQACINLGARQHSLSEALDKVVPGASSKIISKNDRHVPYHEIVKLAKEQFKGKEHRIISVETEFYHSQLK